MRHLSIPYDKKDIEASLSYTGHVELLRYALILTHGAGGDKDLGQLVTLAEYLSQQHEHLLVIRFTCKGLNITYRTRVYKHVMEYVMEKYPNIEGCFLGGRSMGARAAVLVANDVRKTLSLALMGVICLSYPLHPPNDQDNRRDEPLYELQKPVLFVSGTNDAMCNKFIFEDVYSKLSNAQVIWIEGGDHGLNKKGKDGENWQDRINISVSHWCHSLMDGGDSLRFGEVLKEKDLVVHGGVSGRSKLEPTKADTASTRKSKRSSKNNTTVKKRKT